MNAMNQFHVACIREQEQDMLVVPLKSSFGWLPKDEQQKIVDLLQDAATAAKLVGRVAAIWPEGNGHRFLAPSGWHAFLETLSWDAVIASLDTSFVLPGYTGPVRTGWDG